MQEPETQAPNSVAEGMPPSGIDEILGTVRDLENVLFFGNGDGVQAVGSDEKPLKPLRRVVQATRAIAKARLLATAELDEIEAYKTEQRIRNWKERIMDEHWSWQSRRRRGDPFYSEAFPLWDEESEQRDAAIQDGRDSTDFIHHRSKFLGWTGRGRVNRILFDSFSSRVENFDKNETANPIFNRRAMEYLYREAINGEREMPLRTHIPADPLEFHGRASTSGTGSEDSSVGFFFQIFLVGPLTGFSMYQLTYFAIILYGLQMSGILDPVINFYESVRRRYAMRRRFDDPETSPIRLQVHQDVAHRRDHRTVDVVMPGEGGSAVSFRREADAVYPFWVRLLYQTIASFFLTLFPWWRPDPDLVFDEEAVNL